MKHILTTDDYQQSTYHCDYLIIGTGAGGSVAGTLLAEAGHKVIFLEEGGYYPTTSFNKNIGEMTTKLYRNGGVFPFIGSPMVALAEGCCVGGGTVINGAGIFETPKWILKEWENNGLKGYSYAELEKHFATIKQDLHLTYHELEDDNNRDTAKLIAGAKKLGWRTEKVLRAAKGCTNLNLCSIGCPTGAKQSTLVTYLPRALNNGAHIFANCRATKIKHKDGIAHEVIAEITDKRGKKKKKISLRFKNLVVAAGTIQTPHLLRKSKLSTKAGENFEFHMNIKVIAHLDEEINAEVGTMFPVQIHEFEREDMYINTSVLKPQYLTMSLSPHGNKVIDRAIKNYKQMIILNTTMRNKSKANIISRVGKNPFVCYKFSPQDLPKIKRAIRRKAQLLFQSGATKIYLPIQGTKPVNSLNEVDFILREIKPSQIETNTVHMMSSCPMGSNPKNSVVNPDGKLWDTKNVFIADASILPTSIGQSPQGTIMVLVHEIMRRHLTK